MTALVLSVNLFMSCQKEALPNQVIQQGDVAGEVEDRKPRCGITFTSTVALSVCGTNSNSVNCTFGCGITSVGSEVATSGTYPVGTNGYVEFTNVGATTAVVVINGTTITIDPGQTTCASTLAGCVTVIGNCC